MDEEELAREHARLIRRTMGSAGLDIDQVWLHYFSLGGEAGMLEVDAYLHHALAMPRLQRDTLAHAINELIDFGPRPHAPYACDLTDEDPPPEELWDDDPSDPS